MAAERLCDLIARLSTFPPETRVLAEWEGTWNTIGHLDLETTTDRHAPRFTAGRPILILRVDGSTDDQGSHRIDFEEDWDRVVAVDAADADKESSAPSYAQTLSCTEFLHVSEPGATSCNCGRTRDGEPI